MRCVTKQLTVSLLTWQLLDNTGGLITPLFLMRHISSQDGKTTNFHDLDGKYFIETSQDISGIIESNKAQFNAIDEKAKWGEWTKIASIPNSVIDDLNKQGIMRGFAVLDEKRFRAFLNNPDNRFFRTRPGQV